jgi:hypothetical protein
MVIERDDRIDGRALIVVSSDAIEIGLDQPARRETRFERSMDILKVAISLFECGRLWSTYRNLVRQPFNDRQFVAVAIEHAPHADVTIARTQTLPETA